MKSIIAFTLLQLLNSECCIAQCDKKITWYSVRQEMVTPDGKTEEAKTDTLIITTTKNSITIAMQGKDEPFVATLRKPFVNGLKCLYPERLPTKLHLLLQAAEVVREQLKLKEMRKSCISTLV